MMKKIFLLALAFAVFMTASAQTNEDIQNYINTYKDLAINEMIRTGVPASITLAQGILESQAGESDLVKQSNNHFGIKCKTDWTGNVVYHDDDTKNECFRVYASAEDSYRDHSDFLKSRPNYSFLFQLDPTDYIGWAKGLKKAGYALEKDYPQSLIKLIVDNNLQEYTLLALQKEQHPADQPLFVLVSNKKNKQKEPKTLPKNTEPAQKATEQAIENTAPEAPVVTYPAGVFTINETRVLYVQAGTSLFALASNYNISFQKLLEFNELEKTDILNNAQLIFLERKPKKGVTDFHVVANNETLEDIAQEEGIREESLLEYNHLSKGDEPMPGEKIYLKYAAVVSPKLLTAFNNPASSISGCVR